MIASPSSVNFAAFATNLYEGYTALSLRERLLVTLAVLAVTWMVWSATLGGFLESSKAQLERDIDSVYSRMQAAVAEQTALESAKANDPNLRLDRERVLLDQELAELADSMSTVLDRFVPPQRMPALLEDVIRHHRGLSLKHMQSLPVETIVIRDGATDRTQLAAPTVAQANDGAEQTLPEVYRHPLRMVFEGDYFEVAAYLEELEASDWEFGWRRLEYVVTDYPVAEVTLEIETLSQEKNWIGV